MRRTWNGPRLTRGPFAADRGCEPAAGYFKPNWKSMLEPSFNEILYKYVLFLVRFFVEILKIHC